MTDISFSKDSFTQTKLFIGAPMYGRMSTSSCLKGMIDLSAACINYDIPFTVCGITNQSLVQKARNSCVDSFLRSDFTHFLFIDADIGFTAKDVLSLLHILASDKEEKYDVLAGLYPKKTISWEQVKCAATRGLVDSNAESLEDYTGSYALLPFEEKAFSSKEPIEVLKVDAGFMMVPRGTFEKFKKTYPENTYLEPKEEEAFAFFDCAINPETKYYMTEDHRFCEYVRKMGGKIWAAPWLKLSHQGSYCFKGSFENAMTMNLHP
ncbi:MAG: hypothetical protein V4489_01280 [Chlamydiota bacterium]